MTNAHAALIAAASQVPYDGPGRTDETLWRAEKFLLWLEQSSADAITPGQPTAESDDA